LVLGSPAVNVVTCDETAVHEAGSKGIPPVCAFVVQHHGQTEGTPSHGAWKTSSPLFRGNATIPSRLAIVGSTAISPIPVSAGGDYNYRDADGRL